MPLSFREQYEVGRDAVTTGDIDLLTKVMTKPNAVTFEEQQGVAKRLGLKGGFLAAATNFFSDPLVWTSFLLSAKFPTAALVKGIIPSRFYGHGAEWSGASKVMGVNFDGLNLAGPANLLKTMSGRYNKTLIPRLISTVVDRRSRVMRMYEKYDEIAKTHADWGTDRHWVSLLLDGQSPAGARPELHNTAKRIRDEVLDPFWDLISQTQHIVGGDLENISRGKWFAKSMSLEEAAKSGLRNAAPQYLRNWIAHLPIHVHTNDALFQVTGDLALKRLGQGQIAKQLGTAPKNGKYGPWMTDRFGRVTSDWAEFQHFTGTRGHKIYNENLFKRSRDLPINAQMAGQDVFVTDLDFIMGKVFSDGARSYSLGAPLNGAERAAIRVRVKDESGAIIDAMPTNDPPLVQIINNGVDAALGGTQQRAAIGQAAIAGAPVATPRFIADPGGPKRVGTNVRTPSHFNSEVRALQTLVRDLKGMSSDHDVVFNNLWRHVVPPLMRRMQSKSGKKVADETYEAMQSTFDRADYRQKVNMLTTMTYRGTLGLNVGSTVTNAMQLPITTVPGIGAGATMAGAVDIARGVQRMILGKGGNKSLLMDEYAKVPNHMTGYQRLREAWERSYRRAFPEMQDIHVARPEAFDLDMRAFETQQQTPPKTVFEKFGRFMSREDVSSFIMQPFMSQEFLNKGATLYGARRAFRQAYQSGAIPKPKIPMAGKDGKETFVDVPLDSPMFDDILAFESKQFMRESQMPPMPGARTTWQYNYLNPMLRMFQGFATRLYNHYADTTIKGAMTNAEMEAYRSMSGVLQMAKKEGLPAAMGGAISANLAGGRNLGQLARVYLYSSALTNGVRETMGINLDRALGVTSSIPTAPDWQPFAPLPTPPVVGQVFGTIEAMATRDIDRMQPLQIGDMKIPVPKTLFPGGVGLSRFFKAWTQFRPDMGGRVDEDERLIYKSSTLDTLMASLGIPLEKARHEKQMMERLRDNRSVIRELRRKYLVARNNADFETMDQLQAQHKKLFPDLPAMSTGQKYLNIYRANQQRTRVIRMLKSMGQATPRMEQAIIDVDPDLYSVPSMPMGIPA